MVFFCFFFLLVVFTSPEEAKAQQEAVKTDVSNGSSKAHQKPNSQEGAMDEKGLVQIQPRWLLSIFTLLRQMGFDISQGQGQASAYRALPASDPLPPNHTENSSPTTRKVPETEAIDELHVSQSSLGTQVDRMTSDPSVVFQGREGALNAENQTQGTELAPNLQAKQDSIKKEESSKGESKSKEISEGENEPNNREAAVVDVKDAKVDGT
ncbi:hypothetical protein ERJ75_000081000 [Trypanosoma vivax]|nr:hypothetical protein ERJ75_000081000 [Trypanosoma vivax]